MVDICTIPPKGWRCTRAAGHDGPCAVIEHDMADYMDNRFVWVAPGDKKVDRLELEFDVSDRRLVFEGDDAEQGAWVRCAPSRNLCVLRTAKLQPSRDAEMVERARILIGNLLALPSTGNDGFMAGTLRSMAQKWLRDAG